jgi:iron(III) transport system substrate-binding protein
MNASTNNQRLWGENDVLYSKRFFLRAGALGLAGYAASRWPALAQSGSEQNPSWIVPDLLEPARKEGALTIYSSMNEQEGLPLWKLFEEATGVKVNYVRSSDTAIMGRIAIERRAQQHAWDIVQTTAVMKLPQDFLQPFDVPEVQNLIPEARDKNRRWYGVYANYNSAAYNTNHVKESELPKSWEEFAEKKQWAGKVAIDGTDTEWLSAMFIHYGEERTRKMLGAVVAALKPVVVEGHLALARSVAAGEYWLALNNYVPLTYNQKLAGGPTDIFVLDPVALFFGQVGINTQAPHPKAALLGANFMMSREGQRQMTKAGRIPVRADVPSNPPDVVERLRKHKVIPYAFSTSEEKRLDRAFQEIFKPR